MLGCLGLTALRLSLATDPTNLLRVSFEKSWNHILTQKPIFVPRSLDLVRSPRSRLTHSSRKTAKTVKHLPIGAEYLLTPPHLGFDPELLLAAMR